jgi:hypothetical protein
MTSTVLLLLALFGIKHFLADFAMQTAYMVHEKGIYGAEGGVHHALVHAALTFLILIFFCSGVDQAIGLSALDFAIHYHVDFFKQQLNRNYSTDDRGFWLLLGLDQALHYLTYIGITYIATRIA